MGLVFLYHRRMISLILSESTGQVEFNLSVMIGCWNLLISNDVVNSFVLEKLYMCFTISLSLSIPNALNTTSLFVKSRTFFRSEGFE